MGLTLKERVEKLEAQVERLEKELEQAKPPKEKDWRSTFGIFANDPLYEKAARLGREYRERDRQRDKRAGQRRQLP